MKKTRKRRSFEESAADYAKYCNSDGYLLVSFVTPEGYQVGQWGANVRNGMITITPERQKILEEIHFLWNVKDYCKRMKEKRRYQKEKEKLQRKIEEEQNGRLKKKYKTFEDWLDTFDFWNIDGYVPVEFITPQGERLGKWAAQIRYSQRKITEQQKEELNKRNFRWRVSQEERKKWFRKDFAAICIERKRKELFAAREEFLNEDKD